MVNETRISFLANTIVKMDNFDILEEPSLWAGELDWLFVMHFVHENQDIQYLASLIDHKYPFLDEIGRAFTWALAMKELK